MLHSLFYADDQLIIFAQGEEDMEYMLRNLREGYVSWELRINFKNVPEYIRVRKDTPEISIELAARLNILDLLRSSTGTCDRNIKTIIVRVKPAPIDKTPWIDLKQLY